jgi:hypothetical protein
MTVESRSWLADDSSLALGRQPTVNDPTNGSKQIKGSKWYFFIQFCQNLFLISFGK